MEYLIKKDMLIQETDNIFIAVQQALKHGANIYCNNQIILKNTDINFTIKYHHYEFDIDIINKKVNSCPVLYYPKSQRIQQLEYHSGAYNYLYSKSGYQMLTAEMLLSEAVYKTPVDGSKWNGYIIINHKAIDEIDFGLIAIKEGDCIAFKPFMYYMGGKLDKEFKVYDEYTITKMKQVGTNAYSFADNIKIEMSKNDSGWTIEYTNLSTRVTTPIRFQYPSIHHGHAVDRFLIGVSLCPVNEKIWNPLSKAEFSNVVFKRVLMNHKAKLFPGSPSMSEGFSQGVPFSYYKRDKDSFAFSTVYDEVKKMTSD